MTLIIVGARYQAPAPERPRRAPAWIDRILSMKLTDAETNVHVLEPDAHGQAALLLAESILHALIDRSVFTNLQAVGIVVSAAEIKREVATAAGESKERMNHSLALLSRMAESLATDEPM